MPRPEFYTGEPVEPDDLWFRDDFIDLVWEKLRRQHVLVTTVCTTTKVTPLCDRGMLDLPALLATSPFAGV